MKRFLALLAVLLIAAPAWGANRSCNTQLVLDGVCRDSANLLLFYDAPSPSFIDLRDAIAQQENYQLEIICASSRQFQPLLNGSASSVLTAAGQTVDSCTVGAVVSNPQSAGGFADAVIDRDLRNRVIQWKLNSAQVAADDPTSIPTPDTGAAQ